MKELAPFGDRAVRFALAADSSRRHLLAALRAIAGVVDVVLAEEIGSVVFADDADRTTTERELAKALAAGATELSPAAESRTHSIDVVYDGEDLDAVARALGRSRDAVIALHAEREYRVAMLGFLPGFAYLRGLPDELRLPRRAPRPRVPANSIAMAAQYTGIYPFVSPGGWHLLGRAVGFEAFGESGATLAVGDTVRFTRTAEAPSIDRPRSASEASIPTRPHLEISRATGFGLLVDGGRPGRMHEGIPPGGPLVRSAFARANAAVGNPETACAVELSGSFEVVARGGALVIADGARSIALPEGGRHVVATAGQRVRYLAIAGGIDAPIVLGGRGALLVAGIGGLLRKGARIVPREASRATEPLSRAPIFARLPRAIIAERPRGAESAPADADEGSSSHEPIEVTGGPDVIDGLDLEALTSGNFRISASSDRTGTRLDGPPLLGPPTASAIARTSAPMVLGAIELTPSGLIVLGPDHPTTGGYPVIGVVRSSSLDALFSRPIGAPIRLTLSFDQARPS
jgi:KipI family sensor histidine kinase inhibitor